MNPFSMVAVIVVVALIASAITKMVQAKYDGRIASKEDQSLVARLQNEVDGLKERVKTLEALVTDNSYRVKSEIDKL